jgi:hypothetical protein
VGFPAESLTAGNVGVRGCPRHCLITLTWT